LDRGLERFVGKVTRKNSLPQDLSIMSERDATWEHGAGPPDVGGVGDGEIFPSRVASPPKVTCSSPDASRRLNSLYRPSAAPKFS